KAVETISSLSLRFDDFLSEYRKENQSSAEYTRAILKEMQALVGHIVGERPKTVVLRAISNEDAKQEILALFKSKKDQQLFYSDISEQLQLDLEQVVQICHELEEEGRIGMFSKP
ncbi:MAG TPA: hypothetical protein VGY98_06625, partial [Verrucomicrobiae bacterium]|nr:hypothetical protein [Verrucomicrobiae bacterium]